MNAAGTPARAAALAPNPDPWERVAAVAVTHHSAAVIGQCLETVRRCAQVVVVDNASDDDSVAIARRAVPHAQVLENAVGVGYGNGANQALCAVEREFALLVNPDSVVLDGAVEALVAAADRYPDAGLLAPLILNPDGTVEPSHDVALFDRPRYADSKRRAMPVPDGDLCAEFVSGAVVLVRMDAVRRVGGFDPAYFLYFDDDDMCMTLRRAGYAIVQVPDARVTHVGGGSVRPSLHYRWEKHWHMTWSRLQFGAKHRSAADARRLAARTAARLAGKAAGYALFDWPKAWRDAAGCAGALAFLAGRPANRPDQRRPGPGAEAGGASG